MPSGTVKWFNNEKKYGFILIGEREVFVHFSEIRKEGYKTLKKGQMVECDIVKGARGERAVNVRERPVSVHLPAGTESGARKGTFLSRHAFHAKHAEPNH